MTGVIGVVLAYQLFCGLIGHVLGRDRHRPLLGAVLGYVFGVIGLFLLVLAIPRPSAPGPSTPLTH